MSRRRALGLASALFFLGEDLTLALVADLRRVRGRGGSCWSCKLNFFFFFLFLLDFDQRLLIASSSQSMT